METNTKFPQTRELLDKTSGKIYNSYREMINDYILRCSKNLSSLRKKEVSCKLLDQEGFAVITYDKLNIGINVIEKSGILVILCELFEVPKKRQKEFFQRLLELNFLETFEGAFCINKDNNTICMRAFRRLGGLDYEEFEDLVDTIAIKSNYWQNVLLLEY